MPKLVLVPFLLWVTSLPMAAHPRWQQRCEPPRRRVLVRPGPVFLPVPPGLLRPQDSRCEEAGRDRAFPRHHHYTGRNLRFWFNF